MFIRYPQYGTRVEIEGSINMRSGSSATIFNELAASSPASEQASLAKIAEREMSANFFSVFEQHASLALPKLKQLMADPINREFVIHYRFKSGATLRDWLHIQGNLGCANWLEQFDIPCNPRVKKALSIWYHHLGAWKELMPQALPDAITIAKLAPINKSELTQQSRSEFETNYGIQFSTLLCPESEYYYMADAMKEEESRLPSVVNNNLVLVDMGKCGLGLFSGEQGLQKGMLIPYGGIPRDELHESCRSDSQYIASRPDTATIDALQYRHFGAFAQHCPATLDNIYFLDERLAANVAIENVIFTPIPLAECFWNPLCNMEVIRPIEPFELIGLDYTDSYWMSQDCTPELFDKQGRVIPRVFYHAPITFVHDRNCYLTANSRDLMKCCLANSNVIIEGVSVPHQVLKSILIDRGFIPTPTFFKNKKEDFQYQLRVAAADGNTAMLDYLLNYSQRPVDIDATGRDSGKTALHFAVKNNQYYAAWYLIIKGARIDIPDKDEKTVLHLAEAQENKEMLDLLQRNIRVNLARPTI